MPDVEQKFQKRRIAHKLSIGNIVQSRYVKTGGADPNFLDNDSKQIFRINLIAVVVQKTSQDSYGTLMLEDGTGRISARMFDKNSDFSQVEVGNIVLIVGRPREFSSEKYILMESIKNVNPLWAKVRALELAKSTGDGVLHELAPKDVEAHDPLASVLDTIRALDKGEGVLLEDLSSKNIEEVDRKVEKLLKDGDIFEIRKGRLKVLE